MSDFKKYTKEPCPKCREEGKDRSGDNLVRYADGGARCFSCGHTEPKGGTKAPKSKLTVEQVKTYPVGGNPKRMIPDVVTELYDIRVSVDVTTGDTDTVYYPYYNSGGMYACKIRKIADKKFFWVDTPEGFFGKQACHGESPVLIITEGEEDALAVKTVLMDPKYGPPKPYHVVSVPNGAALDKTVTTEADFLSKYRKVFLCFDNDEPGRKGVEQVADWISTLTSTYVATLPEDYKDASDALVAGNGNVIRTAMSTAKLYEPEGIVSGSDITLDSLLAPLEEGYKIPFVGMQDKLHGLRKAEIVTVCAGSGIGKSTLTRELAKSLIEQNCTVAVVALEDQMQVAAQALVALDMNIPLNKFRFSPPPKHEVQASYDKMINNGKTFFFKHFGGLTSENLINKLYYYARAKKCDFIILDHLSMVISASSSNNERKDIDTLMTQLAKMVVETGVGLIQVVHLKRTSGDKSFAKGGEVELTDLRGSAALEQLSWAVVGLERDQQGDDSDFSKIRILKNRTFGFTGLCDTVKYDSSTGRLVNVTLAADTEVLDEVLSGH